MYSGNLYDMGASYGDNLANPPVFRPKLEFAGDPRKELTGRKVYAPVGIAAGPLLDSNFIGAAVDMGANIVTYKTVRTQRRECLAFPNCVFLGPDAAIQPGGTAVSRNEKSDTITNSFGMPSSDPSVWMPDVAVAQNYVDARPGRMMIVSVVGTPSDNPGDAVEYLANDYARCAAMAKDAGAGIIELNLSCPNVRKDLGALYQDENAAAMIISAARKEIGNEIPLFIKVGYWQNPEVMRAVVSAALKAGVSGFVGINTISMNVVGADGNPALPGRLSSGVCGRGIEWYARDWLKSATGLRAEMKADFVIGASGGVVDAAGFTDRLSGGADFALTATGAMLNPNIFAEYFNGVV